MRLGRLVAAGLVAGAVTGFVGALLRPRSVDVYGPPARPVRGLSGDLAAATALSTGWSTHDVRVRPVAPPGAGLDESGAEAPGGPSDDAGSDQASSDQASSDRASSDQASSDQAPSQRVLDVDAYVAEAAAAAVAGTPSRRANG